jgi:hypothetical protein
MFPFRVAARPFTSFDIAQRALNQIRRDVTLSIYALLSIAAISPAVSSPAVASECIESTRSFSLIDGSARLRGYVCRTDGTSQQPTIRIEFNRLSEIAIGSLIKGTTYPEIWKAFGKVTMARNPISTELDKLFDTYGTKLLTSTCYNLAVQVPANIKDYKQHADVCGRRTIWYLTFPDQMNYEAKDISLPAAQKYIATHSDWPKEFRFYYSDDCKVFEAIECTTIWRNATLADFDSYEKTPSDNDGMMLASPKNLALLKYLMKNSWLDDFATVTGTYDGCGGFSFSLHLRQLITDVAFIENVSDKPLSLDGFFGSEITSDQLQKEIEASQDDASNKELAIQPLTIAPGEKVAVPLRLTFAADPSLSGTFQKNGTAERIFARIQTAKPNTLFRLSDGGSLKKVRESFGKPSAPQMGGYLYGPRENLESIVVSGNKVDIKETARNFVRVTAGDGYGSCPYLYVWDEKEDAWVWYGKILRGAHAKNKEMRQEIKLTSPSTRIRISEEEAEASFIHDAILKIELKDGSKIILHPVGQSDARRLSDYQVINAGGQLILEFELPRSVPFADIRGSSLIVSGYYERQRLIGLSQE